jgi:hypothetical protein
MGMAVHRVSRFEALTPVAGGFDHEVHHGQLQRVVCALYQRGIDALRCSDAFGRMAGLFLSPSGGSHI